MLVTSSLRINASERVFPKYPATKSSETSLLFTPRRSNSKLESVLVRAGMAATVVPAASAALETSMSARTSRSTVCLCRFWMDWHRAEHICFFRSHHGWRLCSIRYIEV